MSYNNAFKKNTIRVLWTLKDLLQDGYGYGGPLGRRAAADERGRKHVDSFGVTH